MKLLTKEIREKIPPLYANEEIGNDAPIVVKFFTPDGNWTWFATEGEPQLNEEGNEIDFLFYGYIDSNSYCSELGYFVLSELETNRGPLGLPIERDMHFSTKTLKEVMR